MKSKAGTRNRDILECHQIKPQVFCGLGLCVECREAFCNVSTQVAQWIKESEIPLGDVRMALKEERGMRSRGKRSPEFKKGEFKKAKRKGKKGSFNFLGSFCGKGHKKGVIQLLEKSYSNFRVAFSVG